MSLQAAYLFTCEMPPFHEGTAAQIGFHGGVESSTAGRPCSQCRALAKTILSTCYQALICHLEERIVERDCVYCMCVHKITSHPSSCTPS
jgi:hypothetical protein